jgi:hypothetical protein
MKKILWSFLLTIVVFCFFAIYTFILDLQLKEKVPVILPSFFLSIEDEMWNKFGKVQVEGTWFMENRNKYDTVFRTSQIECVRKEKVCSDATATVTIVEDKSFLRVNVKKLQIIKWDDTQIVYFDNSDECVGYIYTIDRITKQVNGIRKLKTNIIKTCEIENEMKLKLINGFDFYQKQKLEQKDKQKNNTLIVNLILLSYLIGLYLIWRSKKTIHTSLST